MSGNRFKATVFSFRCACGDSKCEENDCPSAHELLYSNIFDQFHHKMELIGRHLIVINNEVQKVLKKRYQKQSTRSYSDFLILMNKATDILDIIEDIKEAGNYASVVFIERKIKRLAAEVLKFQSHHFPDLSSNTFNSKTLMNW